MHSVRTQHIMISNVSSFFRSEGAYLPRLWTGSSTSKDLRTITTTSISSEITPLHSRSLSPCWQTHNAQRKCIASDAGSCFGRHTAGLLSIHSLHQAIDSPPEPQRHRCRANYIYRQSRAGRTLYVSESPFEKEGT